ncbi:MAG TPA: hypothetical protein DCZ94_21585 [Lentisphaeria bacterium]|nr:MAG: hypothetical protein A2X48_14515 [Lentisphaerae bacterium GWF2_49_21]HBC89538.1 hypothetical protein [Lentisphaeria bacterium]
MNKDIKIVQVVVPADVSTHTTLTADLETDLGIPSEFIDDCKPVIIAKEGSTFAGKVLDEIPSIAASKLVITEGATGLAVGDIYTVALIKGSLDKSTAVASGEPAT